MMEKLLLFFGIEPKWSAFAWKSYWTTKLSALQVMLGAMAVAFAALPSKWQDAFPDNFGLYCGVATIIVAALTPPAAAAQQPKLLTQTPPES